MNNPANHSMKLFVYTLSLLMLLTQHSFAQDFSGFETFLDEIVALVTGPIGVAISALAVMGVGFSFMTGRMDWTYAAAIIVGIAIVFGGATFVDGLAAV